LPKALTKHQQDLIQSICTKELTIVTGAAGTGKAQPITSSVLTDVGFKTFKDIKVNALVRTVDNELTPILGLYPQGEKDIYKVTFEDGRSALCCKEHLWEVYCYAWGRKGGAETRVLTTEDIKSKLDKKSLANRLYIPLPKPLTLSDVNKKHFISPYLLGVILGDGGITSNAVVITTVDSFIKEKVEAETLLNNYRLAANKISFRISFNGKRSWSRKNPYQVELKRLCLMGLGSKDKFIPKEYMDLPVEQRWELIQGLMDTDGTIDFRGCIQYSTSSPRLRDDVTYLLRSLGCLVKAYVKKTTHANNYILNIRSDNADQMFSLPRKLARVNADYQYAGLKLRIKSVIFSHKEEAVCIKIDDARELYITDNFIVTHNTFIPAAYAAYFYSKGIVDKIVIVRPNVPVGKGVGFLPGTLEEKLEPWARPVVSVLQQFLSKGEVDCMSKNEKLIVTSLDLIRGLTFNNAFVILDEAQNVTKTEMVAFCTRIGKDSKTVIDGDTFQCDLKNNEKSGLEYLEYLLEDVNNDELANNIGSVHFSSDDCVRSGICRLFIRAFEGG
jgi:phosphate starvation-inducible protein PhoH